MFNMDSGKLGGWGGGGGVKKLDQGRVCVNLFHTLKGVTFF